MERWYLFEINSIVPVIIVVRCYRKEGKQRGGKGMLFSIAYSSILILFFTCDCGDLDSRSSFGG
jgi:hypothetical protein